MITREEVVQGKIIKGIGGFYYVKGQARNTVIECKARGLLRHHKIVPTVGDQVTLVPESTGEWTISEIQPRKNIFVRPPVANVDIALIVFAMKDPKPNLLLLDKLLINSEIQNVAPVICFTKRDLVSGNDEKMLREIYHKTPYPSFYIRQGDRDAIDKIAREIAKKTAFMAGPSGAGKSTLANILCENQTMETGGLSRKLKSGKHTTRHVELLETKKGGFLLDTPGFSTYKISSAIELQDLQEYFPDFEKGLCRFKSCLHKNEPDCAVKKSVEEKKISHLRYEHYLSMLDEMKQEKNQ